MAIGHLFCCRNKKVLTLKPQNSFRQRPNDWIFNKTLDWQTNYHLPWEPFGIYWADKLGQIDSKFYLNVEKDKIDIDDKACEGWD